MMKIHTTQDLNVTRTFSRPTSNMSFNDTGFIIGKRNEPHLSSSIEPSFKGKSSIVNKVTQKPLKKGLEKLLNGKFFDAVIGAMEHEVVAQAAIAAVICMILRPLTILALPSRKNKSTRKADNAYAATHSICSGVMSIASSLLISLPFSRGNRATKASRYLRNLKAKGKDIEPVLQRLKKSHPHLDIKSVVDEMGNIHDESKWLDLAGKRFVPSMDKVMTVACPTHLSEVSPETMKTLGVDIEESVLRGSLNDAVTKDGKKLSEALKTKDMFIAIKEDGMGGSVKGFDDTNFFSLQLIDKYFLEKADPNIDVSSMEMNGVRRHASEWLNKDGTKWLDMDRIHISSYRETPRSQPVYTGKYRDPLKAKKKYMAYQDNVAGNEFGAVPDKLGSEIYDEYLLAHKKYESKDKVITWLPDILTRVPMAMLTIALIPWTLKHVFHMEKGKTKEQTKQEITQKRAEKVSEPSFKGMQSGSQVVPEESGQVSFGGLRGNSIFDKISARREKFLDKIANFFAEKYAEPIKYGRDWVQKFADRSARSKDSKTSMTQHMTVLGSLITSATYMFRTMTNKKLDNDRRTTLTINQGLCFAVPTAGAYIADAKLKNRQTDFEHLYRGVLNQRLATGKVSEKDAERFMENIPNKIRGVRALFALATFTLIYRYLTPVLMTPLANNMGDRRIARKKAKAARKAAELQKLHQQQAGVSTVEVRTETVKKMQTAKV